jgi:hypothetical protein
MEAAGTARNERPSITLPRRIKNVSGVFFRFETSFADEVNPKISGLLPSFSVSAIHSVVGRALTI